MFSVRLVRKPRQPEIIIISFMTSKIIIIAPNKATVNETVLDRIEFQISNVKKSQDGRAICLYSPQPVRSIHQSIKDFDCDGDIFVLDAKKPTPQLLICDMDSTIIESETLDDLAAAFGLEEKVSAITERAMRGEMDFATALFARVEMLKDLQEQAILDLLPKLKISEGADTLIQAARSHGIKCLLVSGGFTHVTGYVADKLGFDAHHGNSFIIKGGRLTGRVQEPIQDKTSKLKILNEMCDEMDISDESVMAIGDGANDIPMLEAAGYGIAYKAKPLVRAAVPLQINNTDLSSATYIFEFQ